MAALGPNLSHRLVQSQTLALTPAMQLKLKLWQMNLLELSQTIEHELQENPLLELVEEGEDALLEHAAAGTDALLRRGRQRRGRRCRTSSSTATCPPRWRISRSGPRTRDETRPRWI